ncbi:hypothetical protein ES703_120576 [subsurface metagenome]
MAFLGLGVLSAAVGIMTLQRYGPLAQRVYSQDGTYLVDVRYGDWRDIRSFVQPTNPDVVAIYHQYGPHYWSLYDFVCHEIDYRRDVGEYWMTPSETLRGFGDCEDCAILLTSLIRAGGARNCYVALGSLGDLGHAWCELNGQVLETTYTFAKPVPNPEDYKTLAIFNDQEVIEFWPGALDEVFEMRRDEATKLNLIAKAVA